MTPDEQITLVFDIAEREACNIAEEIRNGKIPESWDGIELRWLLAERLPYRTHYDPSLKRRKRAYNNICIVNGL